MGSAWLDLAVTLYEQSPQKGKGKEWLNWQEILLLLFLHENCDNMVGTDYAAQVWREFDS